MKASRLMTISGVVAATVLTATVLTGCVQMSSSSMGQPAPTMSRNSEAGTILTDQRGMTVYTYDEDTAGVSNCTGLCATAWPPVLAPADAKSSGDLTIVTRADGSKQWAKGGMPLYTYDSDKQPGDIKGDNIEGIWHIVRP